MKRFVFSLLLLGSWLTQARADSNWQSVEKILGRKGVSQGDVFKVTFPRTDLNVTVNGIPLEPGLALTSWFAFKPMAKGTMVMGDLVLLDEEVSKVLAPLVRNGIEVTAIHNHLLNESPNIKYMHIAGQGSRANLAEALKAILSFTGTPQGAPLPVNATLAPSPDPSRASGPDWSGVQGILGPGRINGKLLQYGFPRAEPVTEEGMEIPPFMGMATSLNLQMNGEKAAGTGDFVLTAEEVNPVVEALTKHHITVTAIHSHMLKETPRLFFLHFWAQGAPLEIAEGLKAALKRIHLAQANP